VVRGRLHADDPLTVHDDAVPTLVRVHLTVEQASPEATLRSDVGCVEHDDSSPDLHAHRPLSTGCTVLRQRLDVERRREYVRRPSTAVPLGGRGGRRSQGWRQDAGRPSACRIGHRRRSLRTGSATALSGAAGTCSESGGPRCILRSSLT
jgi:hypothetical protein